MLHLNSPQCHFGPGLKSHACEQMGPCWKAWAQTEAPILVNYFYLYQGRATGGWLWCGREPAVGSKHGQEARRPSWRKSLSSCGEDGGHWLGGGGAGLGVRWEQHGQGLAEDRAWPSPGQQVWPPALPQSEIPSALTLYSRIPPKGNLVGKEVGPEPARWVPDSSLPLAGLKLCASHLCLVNCCERQKPLQAGSPWLCPSPSVHHRALPQPWKLPNGGSSSDGVSQCSPSWI